MEDALKIQMEYTEKLIRLISKEFYCKEGFDIVCFVSKMIKKNVTKINSKNEFVNHLFNLYTIEVSQMNNLTDFDKTDLLKYRIQRIVDNMFSKRYIKNKFINVNHRSQYKAIKFISNYFNIADYKRLYEILK